MCKQNEQDELTRLRAENKALRQELLTPEVFIRVAQWLSDPKRKGTAVHFTAGIERQIAYLLESNILPEVRKMQYRMDIEQNARTTLVRALNSSNSLLTSLAENKESAVIQQVAYNNAAINEGMLTDSLAKHFDENCGDAKAALENIRLFAARHRAQDWTQTVLRFCEEGGSKAKTMRKAARQG